MEVSIVGTVALAALLAQAPPALMPTRPAPPSQQHTTTRAAVGKPQLPNRPWRDAFTASQPAPRGTSVPQVPEPTVHEQMANLERQARVGMILYKGRFDRSELALTQPAGAPSSRGR